MIVPMSTTPAQRTEIPRSEIVPVRLRAALAALDLSVAAAARRLDWTQSNFQRQTKGQVKLSIDQLEWIEERLGIPMLYLLGFTDELPSFSRRLRTVPAPDPAEVVFYDGSGEPKRSTASGESFLAGSNRRPFHYKGDGSNILPFRPRTPETPTPCQEWEAEILPFPVAASH